MEQWEYGYAHCQALTGGGKETGNFLEKKIREAREGQVWVGERAVNNLTREQILEKTM